MSTLSHAEKRRVFAERFTAWLTERQLSVFPEWFSAAFPQDNNIASFIDREQGRCMRIEEAEFGDLELDFFFARAGMHGELSELFFRARDVHDKLEVVGKAYQWWFIDRASEEAIETRLDALAKPLEET